jgi:hypothetical protein
VKQDWTARSLLRDVARADPPFHALIDSGALITGLDNEEVARYVSGSSGCVPPQFFYCFF